MNANPKEKKGVMDREGNAREKCGLRGRKKRERSERKGVMESERRNKSEERKGVRRERRESSAKAWHSTGQQASNFEQHLKGKGS